MLVKPQFELQPGDLAKGGIVKDASLYEKVEQRIRESYVQAGLKVKNYFESPISGGDGNREFFVHAVNERIRRKHEFN
jgi:23S rRNA (cytidine1920-2'-O)/16S rRNA (cytidine1409-2'-O)-methyltransferase